jgi:ATP-dependent RNA helicase MRH4, mitochondrial
MTSDLWYFSARTAVPSRTHLVKDLTPKLPTGLPCKSTRKLLEVAPRDAQSKFTARNRTLPDKKMSLRGVPLRTRDRLGTQSGQRRAKKKHEYVRARGARGDRRDRSSSTGKVASDIAAAEFDFSTTPEAPHTLPSTFSSPPLSFDLLQSVHDLLGDHARPTPIQSLSLKHLFDSPPPDANHRRFLLASETGSGKSLAYLLPMMHGLKATEHLLARRTGPRALVLAPTHELSRQLASFGKALVHHARLRVQSASRANIVNSGGTSRSWTSAAKMANAFHIDDDFTTIKGEFEVHSGASGIGHAVDVLVGTPSRMLEMARGTGWNKGLAESDGARRKKPEVSLSDVEWVVVDEADVLFGTFALTIYLPHYFFSDTYEIGSDFIDHTLLLLSDVAAARGKPVPVISRTNESTRTQAPTPLDYPFNFVLTSATIPVALAAAYC